MRTSSLMPFLTMALVYVAASAGAGETLKWSHGFPSMPNAPTLFPDAVNPSGIAVTTAEGVYLFKGDGTLNWEHHPDKAVVTPATVADLDGDAAPEVLFCLKSGEMICLDARGAVRWRHRFESGEGVFKYVTAADVVADSPGLELLIGFDDGRLHCVSAEGKGLWDFYCDKRRISPVAVGDTNADGTTEIVFGTDNGNVYCLNGAGQTVWRYTAAAPYGRSGPVIADLDADGRAELLITRSNVGTDPGLAALDGATGGLLWKTQDILHGYVSNAIADLDGDGRFEVIHADKANWVYCVNADGSERWRTELTGNGIFYAPVVGDLDGDGKLEVVAAVRDTNPATGVNVFILADDGTIKSELKLARNANQGPALGDIDGDGQLELLLSTENPSELRVLTWGGRGRVAWPSLRGNSAMTGLANVPPGKPAHFAVPAPSGDVAVEDDAVLWGRNVWRVSWKEPTPENAFLELSAAGDDGFRTVWTAEVQAGATQSAVEWKWMQDGKAIVDVRLLAAGRKGPWGALRKSVTPESPDACRYEEVENTVRAAVAKGDAYGADTLGLGLRLARLRTARAALTHAHEAGTSGKAIADSATDLREEAEAVERAAATAASLWEGGDTGGFIWWEDANPWDAFDPSSAPGAVDLKTPIRISAFGDESESVAVNLLNLTADPLEVRCVFQKPEFQTKPAQSEPPLAKHFTLRRSVGIPSDLGFLVNDALPELDGSRTLTLVPGVTRQLWIVANTRGLEPGTHTITLYLGSLSQTPVIREVPIQLEILPVKLPEGVYAMMNWTTIDIGETSDQQLRDMLDHNGSVAYGPKLPSVPVDANGAAAGPVDWAHVDASLARLPAYFQLLFHGPPPLAWPPGVQPDPKSDAQRNAFTTSVKVLVDHLAAKGFGYERWAFYPYDEPWLTGFTLIPLLREFCQRIREIDPRIRLYTNPAGLVRVEYLREFADLIDIWQPEMNLLKRDPNLVAWFQDNAKTLWAYEANDRAKNLLPLGYYRAHAWLAWLFGLDGAGFWVYKYGDDWWPLEGPNWSAVYQTNDHVVPSRRWEACRDGVDDYRMLAVLREETARVRAAGHAAQADRAQALSGEAVEKIIAWQAKHIDEITRQTREHEIDFALFKHYRTKIAEEILRLRAL